MDRLLSDYRRISVVHHEPVAGAAVAQEFEVRAACVRHRI